MSAGSMMSVRPPLRRSDLCAVAAWMPLYFIAFWIWSVLWQLLTLQDAGMVAWTMAAVATVLMLARRHGHAPMVLGICCAAILIKTAPWMAGIFLAAASIGYVLLFWLPRHGQIAFKVFWWLLLIFLLADFMVTPLAATLWSGLTVIAAAGLMLRLYWVSVDCARGRCGRPGYFEFLGYVAMIPQFFVLLPVRPAWSRSWHDMRGAPENNRSRLLYVQALKVLGMIVLRLVILRVLMATGLTTTEGPPSLWLFWLWVPLQYVMLYLWLACLLDMAVVFFGLLGMSLRRAMWRPWLATSVQDWWRRWNIYNRRVVERLSGARANSINARWWQPLAWAGLGLPWWLLVWPWQQADGRLSSILAPLLLHGTLLAVALTAEQWWERKNGKTEVHGWQWALRWLIVQTAMAWITLPLLFFVTRY